MADKKATLEAIQDLDNDLVKMVDSFGKLVKASKMETEGSSTLGAEHVAGDMFPVLVEKLVHRSELALQKVMNLKKSMTLHNVSDVLGKVKKTAGKLEHFKNQVDTVALKGKGSTALRLKQLLAQLEDHYYACCPQVPEASEPILIDSDLEELCMQALNAPFEL